jgi:hypothetical protein
LPPKHFYLGGQHSDCSVEFEKPTAKIFVAVSWC